MQADSDIATYIARKELTIDGVTTPKGGELPADTPADRIANGLRLGAIVRRKAVAPVPSNPMPASVSPAAHDSAASRRKGGK